MKPPRTKQGGNKRARRRLRPAAQRAARERAWAYLRPGSPIPPPMVEVADWRPAPEPSVREEMRDAFRGAHPLYVLALAVVLFMLLVPFVAPYVEWARWALGG